VLRISPFGLIEMTRQRIRPSIKRSMFTDCNCCNGRGVVKTAESMSIEVIRTLMLASYHPQVTAVTVKVNDQVAAYLNNRKRRELSALEEEGNMTVQVLGSEEALPEYMALECRDQRGNPVHIEGT
jgi:ribonuclease E